MKTCDEYLAEKAKKAKAALGNTPQAAAAPNLSAPILDVVKPIPELSLKQDASPTPLQQRRTILQVVKRRVIDQYVTPLGQVTISMHGHAKLMIEQRLATLPLEELGFEDVVPEGDEVEKPLCSTNNLNQRSCRGECGKSSEIFS
jgi:hypothetical protein